MFELSKLESLALNLETMDDFVDCYTKMLAEAMVAIPKDKKKMRAMKEVLSKQAAFLMVEMMKALKEEHGQSDILQ